MSSDSDISRFTDDIQMEVNDDATVSASMKRNKINNELISETVKMTESKEFLDLPAEKQISLRNALKASKSDADARNSLAELKKLLKG